MDSPLRKQMKELCSAADYLTFMLGAAGVEDVAELRVQLNRIHDAIAGKTNEQVLQALQDIPDPAAQTKGYMSTDLLAGISIFDPDALTVVHEEPAVSDAAIMQAITNVTRARNLQKGVQNNIDFTGLVNARLTAAAAPDLSKCSTMVIKS